MRSKPSFLLHRLLVATYSDVSTSYRTGKHIQMPPTNKNGIPDRWLDYKAVGKKIPGTRFIAFKVPLKQSLNRHVQSSDVFGPKELLAALSKEKQELGLIIDLTYTTRYYKPVDLPDSVFYLKIFTAGHEVPSNPTILSFKQAVRRFLQDNADNEKLIGVHCTHGLNRTGYLVCRYLIDVDGLDPKQAIKLFNSARGHAIERENYLKDLQSGPKRSNQGMDESEQEPIRGQAGSTPPWEREQHGHYNSHRSVPFHQRGMNHQQPRPLHSGLRPPPLLPPPQHHRPRHPPPLLSPPSISGMWSPIPRYQWRPQAQSESAWWRQSPQPNNQYGGSRHENGRGRAFHPQEERRRGPFPPPSAPPYPLLPSYSSEGFRSGASSSRNPRSEERDEPRRKSQHRHRHHDRT